MISRLWERWNRINVAVARTALEALESVIGFAIVAAVLLAPLLVCLAAAKYLFGS